MPVCASCGAQAPEGAAFCPACGVSVASPPAVPPDATVPFTPQVAAPAPAAAEPLAPPAAPVRKKRVVLWVALGIVAVLLLCCGVGAVGYFVYMRPRGYAVTEVPPGEPAEPPVESAETPVAEPPAEPEAPAASAENDGRQFLRITRLYKTGGTIWAEVDFMQLFTGDAAWTEAERRGDEAPNDYYVVNDNPRLRTFEVRADAPVDLAIEGPTDVERMTASEFYDRSRSDPSIVRNWAFFFEIRDGTVMAVENFWTP